MTVRAPGKSLGFALAVLALALQALSPFGVLAGPPHSEPREIGASGGPAPFLVAICSKHGLIWIDLNALGAEGTVDDLQSLAEGQAGPDGPSDPVPTGMGWDGFCALCAAFGAMAVLPTVLGIAWYHWDRHDGRPVQRNDFGASRYLPIPHSRGPPA